MSNDVWEKEGRHHHPHAPARSLHNRVIRDLIHRQKIIKPHLEENPPPTDEIENFGHGDPVPSTVLNERPVGVVDRTCAPHALGTGHGPGDVVKASVALDLDVERVDGAHVDVFAEFFGPVDWGWG